MSEDDVLREDAMNEERGKADREYRDERQLALPQPLGIGAYLAWLVFASAVVFVVVVLALLERQRFESAVASWGREMPIIAVLREHVTDAQAQALAERLRKQSPALEAAVISRREARSLLALQEPWLKQLPEMLVGELPLIVELRHPGLFTAAREIDTFLDSLRSQPEVEFVIFNNVGHERVEDALFLVRRHINVVLGVVCVASVMSLAMLQHHLLRRRPRLRIGPAILVGGAAGALGGAIGALGLWVIDRFALSPGNAYGAKAPLALLAGVVSVTLLVLLELIHAETSRGSGDV
jgi:hypothetical protein